MFILPAKFSALNVVLFILFHKSHISLSTFCLVMYKPFHLVLDDINLHKCKMLIEEYWKE